VEMIIKGFFTHYHGGICWEEIPKGIRVKHPICQGIPSGYLTPPDFLQVYSTQIENRVPSSLRCLLNGHAGCQ